MEKKIFLTGMVVVMVMSLSGCTKTTTVSYTDENGNTTTTTTTTTGNETTTVVENNFADESIIEQETDENTESVTEPIDQEAEYLVVESEDGYRVTYNPEYFEFDDSGEYEGKDSIYIRCTIDEENEYENYIDIGVIKDYNAKELIEGIAFQNDDPAEAVSAHIVFANGNEYDAYYFEKHLTDSFMVTFYAIDGKNGPYLIEVGSHIYADDDEYAYYVAGVMEEAFLDLEFEM